jgi:hypothetical protein
MPTGTDYPIAIVIVNLHEPHGEVAARLLELAEEKGYDARTVEAQRGEHDAGLSFRVPDDVAKAFDGERADLWPDDSAKNRELNLQRVDGTEGRDPKGKSSKIENVGGKAADQGADTETTSNRSRTGKPRE